MHLVYTRFLRLAFGMFPVLGSLPVVAKKLEFFRRVILSWRLVFSCCVSLCCNLCDCWSESLLWFIYGFSLQPKTQSKEDLIDSINGFCFPSSAMNMAASVSIPYFLLYTAAPMWHSPSFVGFWIPFSLSFIGTEVLFCLLAFLCFHFDCLLHRPRMKQLLACLLTHKSHITFKACCKSTLRC